MSEEIQKGTLYVVSTPIGNLDDITLRAIHILRSVDLIAAEDTRKTGFLLSHLGIEKPMVSYYSYNEHRRVGELIAKMRAGASVAVVTDAGTPGISDPAYLVIREAISAGLRVISSPGASALLASLAVSGLPTDRFTFEGFLPVKKGRRTRLQELAMEQRTIVIYESPHRIVKTLGDVLEYMGDRHVAVVREVTKKFEQVERGAASAVRDRLNARAQRGEYVLVVAGTTYQAGIEALARDH
ncbi:MAG TPA: 16S rRNA (cytidine(1402)-2'-O)-methyltransferase [Bacteroidota bacterium]|nr:16S rRNA (cytidine(1402)-2'-O)-methyltransferase [Bacteroidota bacterium]